MRDYDAPDAVKRGFDELCGRGAPMNRFEPLRRAEMDVTDHEPGRSMSATLAVPAVAAFFADHFPRRPVYPATLLLDHQLELARRLAADGGARPPDGKQVIGRVTNAKMRAFVLPGQAVEIATEMTSSREGVAHLALTASAGGKRVSTARAEIRTGEQ